MKRMSAMLLVMLFLLLVGCSAVGTETDYPAAIMAEGTVYLKSVSAMPSEIDESAIIGYTTSYTDTYPEKGQHYMGLILCGAAVFAVGIFFGALAGAVMVSIGIQLEKRRANETQGKK